jgi:phosphoglycerate dehydrogenase-like enzyme
MTEAKAPCDIVLVEQKLSSAIGPLLKEAGIPMAKFDPGKTSLGGLIVKHEPSAVILRSNRTVSAADLDAGQESLRVIGVVGDSLSNIPIPEATMRRTYVMITEYGNANEVALLTLGLIGYMLSDEFRHATADKATIIHDTSTLTCAPSPTNFLTKVIGLIGCGAVAQSLAWRLLPYVHAARSGMSSQYQSSPRGRILGFDTNFPEVYERFHRPNLAIKPPIEYVQIDQLTREADVISLHASANECILMGRDLEAFAKRPILIDTTRGACIPHKALTKAIKNGLISGAALTFPAGTLEKEKSNEEIKPYLAFPNVVLAENPGVPTSEAQKKSIRRLTRAVISHLVTGDTRLAVNADDITRAGVSYLL